MPGWRRTLLRRPPLGRLLLLLLVFAPALAWMLVKPVRVIAPTLAGVACPVAGICIDDPAALDRAIALHAEASSFVAASFDAPEGSARVVFCSTAQCARSFGLGDRSAVTLGTFGTVIGPRAWQPWYVRHELIHQLQARRIGTLRLLLMPRWFVEGMAYAQSEDPRHPLPEPRERWRREFLEWYATVDKATLRERAREL